MSAERLRDEIHELRLFLGELDKLTGEDTKASRLVADVNTSLLDYSSVVVFTQYTDTMDYIRGRLIAAGIHKIGCYSGRGGEVYDHTVRTWASVTKSEIKNLFRSGNLIVLIGTDSMSEGLNLQTSGSLINYDMPWNLMRVEQRIGRVDRIGATYKKIQIKNYFYADTVEEQVYKGIAEDYGDFTDIVGDAAPVLANIEKAIGQLALGDASDESITAQVDNIRGQVEALNNGAVQSRDLGNAPEVTGHVEAPPELHGDVDLTGLERELMSNPLTAPLLTSDGAHPNTYRLFPPSAVAPYSFAKDVGPLGPSDYGRHHIWGEGLLVTFNRETADESTADVTLLTYGSPELAAILPRAQSTSDEQ